MFCPYCGNPCAENHKFCFRCGKPLPELNIVEPVPLEPVVTDGTTEEVPVETILSETEVAPMEVCDQIQSFHSVEESIEIEERTVPYIDDSPAEPVPMPKKGRLWPPVLALCIMICVGLAAFFLAPKAPTPVRSCFTVENGVLYFDATLYTGDEELTVPATVNGMTVTAISENCFADCDHLTTIILPETVTMIGDKAFSGCDALRGIYFPDGVRSVGAGALAQCPQLEAVYFPGSITEIGDGCLDNCNRLQYIMFDGTYTQWRELYDGIFQNQVELHTKDGVYRAQP